MSGEDNNEMVTMSAAEANQLRKVLDLANSLYSDAEDGMEFKKLLKKKGYKVPELDTVEQITKPRDEKIKALEERLNTLSEERETDKKSAKDREEEDALKKTLAAVRKDYNLDDDKYNKVLSRMQEKKSMDAEAAAAYVISKEPKPKLSTVSHNFGPSSFDGKKAFTSGGESADAEWKMLNEDARNGTFNHLNAVADDIFNNENF